MPTTKTIQWFPGHMAKTRRLMTECLPDVDIVLEIRDARIPQSSANPEIRTLLQNKPSLLLLNKCALADAASTSKWIEHYRKEGRKCLAVDCITGEGFGHIEAAVRDVLAEKLERYRAKGMEGRRIRAMIVGIPNVGKSSLINRLCGAKKARVEDRPGVTLSKQWASTNMGLDLLDMPGVLWPKFDDETVGENLAVTGAIRDQIMDIEEIACILLARLKDFFPALLCERYKLDESEIEDLQAYEIFELVGQKRGFLQKGGSINERRTAEILLDEFRGGKIGRMTLELPGEV